MKFKLEIIGETRSDILERIDAARRSFKIGAYHSEFDSSERGSYTFSVQDNEKETNEEFDTTKIESLLTCGISAGGCKHWLAIYVNDIREERKRLNMPDATVSQLIMAGATIPCRDINTDNESVGDLTLEKVISALKAISNGKDLKGNHYPAIKSYFDEFKAGKCTAETADTIIQIAVMGEHEFCR